MNNIVKSVFKGSIADEIGIEKGDILVSIDGNKPLDVLDYKFYCAADEYEIEILKNNGETEIIEVINEDYEELGIEFENGLMDSPKCCKNNCIFCFVNQLPKGMRKTLYFKDDDYRLSALMGNYITLTNLAEDDIDRIINMHLPRINVSVHAADAEVRGKLLSCKNADVMPIIKKIADANIMMNCQIVLCRGINDGEVLDKTISELAKLYPAVQSLSIVPVGLTKYRKNLPKLDLFDKISAEALIAQVEEHQNKFAKDIGTNFVFASDEFYVTAKKQLPSFESYEDFLQIENGVGLLTSLEYEFNCALKTVKNIKINNDVTIITGESAAPYIEGLIRKVSDDLKVIPIKNDFFGHSITVAGLITGQDIINQLKGFKLTDTLLIPSTMLNFDNVFLDDVSVCDIEKELGVKINVVENDGYKLLEEICLNR